MVASCHSVLWGTLVSTLLYCCCTENEVAAQKIQYSRFHAIDSFFYLLKNAGNIGFSIIIIIITISLSQSSSSSITTLPVNETVSWLVSPVSCLLSRVSCLLSRVSTDYGDYLATFLYSHCITFACLTVFSFY